MSKIPKTTLLTGTHEILYVYIVNFYNKLKDNGVEAELNIGEGMIHAYAICPWFPNQKKHLNI